MQKFLDKLHMIVEEKLEKELKTSVIKVYVYNSKKKYKVNVKVVITISKAIAFNGSIIKWFYNIPISAKEQKEITVQGFSIDLLKRITLTEKEN